MKERDPYWQFYKAVIRRYNAPEGNLTRGQKKAVERAIKATEAMPDGKHRIELVQLVFWDGLNIDQAAPKCYASPRTATRWHAQFVRQVGTELRKTWG